MVTQLRLSNVRLFEGPSIWKIDSSAITAICGANSSGKSTILKTLLFLRRNLLGNQDNLGEQTIIEFHSKEMDLGTFFSFVSHNEAERDIAIGISLDWIMSKDSYQTVFSSLFPEGSIQEIPRVGVSLDFTIGVMNPPSQREEKESLVELPTLQNRERPVLKRASCEIHVAHSEPLRWSAERTNEAYKLSFPRRTALALLPHMRVGDHDATRLQKPRSHGFTASGGLSGWLPAYYSGPSPAPSEAKGQIAFYTMPYPIEATNRFIRQSMVEIEYLGPLRAPAQRFYSVQQDTRSSELDAAGEKLPFVLKDMHDIRVVSADPGDASPKTQTLERALNTWLHYLRAGAIRGGAKGGELRIKDIRDVLLEAELTSVTGSERHALADSGFGYSQVLPIIVKILIAKARSTVLIEQPELHLNPALQVRLTDFFVTMARIRPHIQLVIETHSEHIVNALRVAAAEDETNSVSGLISLYYIDASGSPPEILRMSVADDGSVQDWPPAFFGDALSLSSRLLRAQAMKRARRVATTSG